MLMPGTYEGRTTHLGYIKHEETSWMPKRYFLELDTKQIANMGGRAPEHLTLVEYEVTKHVEDGLNFASNSLSRASIQFSFTF